jgi:hypothetical protein
MKSMEIKTIHVIPCGRDWEVKIEGEAAPFYSAEDKEPVVEYARRLACKLQAYLVIHNSEGKVESTETAELLLTGTNLPDIKDEYGDGPGSLPSPG